MTNPGLPIVQRHSRLWRVLGGLCLMLAGWLLLPQTAAASCGDYLVHPQHPMALQRMNAAPHSEHQAPVPTRPCNGPSCRRNDAPLPVPAPAPVQLTGERWAAVFDGEVPFALNGQRFARSAEEFFPSALPQRLDRPPKVA